MEMLYSPPFLSNYLPRLGRYVGQALAAASWVADWSCSCCHWWLRQQYVRLLETTTTKSGSGLRKDILPSLFMQEKSNWKRTHSMIKSMRCSIYYLPGSDCRLT